MRRGLSFGWVIQWPMAPDGLAAELQGDLVEILALAAVPEAGARRRVGAKDSPERLTLGASTVGGCGGRI